MRDFFQSLFVPGDIQNILFAILTLILAVVGGRLLRHFMPRLLQRQALVDRFTAWMNIADKDQLNQRVARAVFWIFLLGGLLISGAILARIAWIQETWRFVQQFFADLARLPFMVILFEILLVLLATFLLFRLVRLVGHWFIALYARIEHWGGQRLRPLKIQRVVLLTARQMTDLFIVTSRYLRLLVSALLVFIYLSLVFSIFPATRGFVAGIFEAILLALGDGWTAFIDYLPNILNLILIIVITRYLLKGIHFLFIEIGKGTLNLRGFYPEWAEPTYQLVRILVIALALVAAFPFIPGSSSPIFQGISIFLGFLFSLGSSSVVANIVSGVVLTYTRAFKVGDRVQIADTIGDVIERTLLVTRLRTIKNVDVTVPNSIVLGSHIINYSSSAARYGLILNTAVTIGYDVPWREVHTALIAAARATAEILEDPAPFVFQTALDDFYVHYEINAYTDQPNQMAVIYSDLHQNIQDSFTAAGIEIMSPHYAALRDGNETTVPPERRPKGYRSPAFHLEIGRKKDGGTEP
ncbi:MAG: mechanosensitive ion channel family protein [Anaerolineales bacterium]|nr:mechanosensitive ion channel family protein [Anaerolineales bacterium]